LRRATISKPKTVYVLGRNFAIIEVVSDSDYAYEWLAHPSRPKKDGFFVREVLLDEYLTAR
jgi:hypothetical protein